jgi:hypothetical protein
MQSAMGKIYFTAAFGLGVIATGQLLVSAVVPGIDAEAPPLAALSLSTGTGTVVSTTHYTMISGNLDAVTDAEYRALAVDRGHPVAIVPSAAERVDPTGQQRPPWVVSLI